MDAKTSSSRVIALDFSSLNARQVAFVREYFKDRNATQAALRAGYSSRCASETGYDLLRHPQVGQLIRNRELELMREADIDEVWVLQSLKKNALRGVELDDLPSVNRSLELIGRHIGMFVDRSNINHTFDQIDQIEVRIVDPKEIDDVDYSVDEKRRRDD